MTDIVVFGCKHTTKEFLIRLIDLHPNHSLFVVTIDVKTAVANKVSGFYDLTDFLDEKEIKYAKVDDYSLRNSVEFIEKKLPSPRCGFCIGWQRLIPEKILKHFTHGVFGMHGSNKPLPHGRGRSPLNWSLIVGRKIFYTHLFKYSPGVDDGDIVGVQSFEITIHDTALTLHYKNLVSMISLVNAHLQEILHGTVKLISQDHSKASFYPKRSAEDGLINWDLSAHDIHNLVRGVTRPFPGAFSFINNNKITIWRAYPFDSILSWDNIKSGQICMIFDNGDFIVQTGDITLIVVDYCISDNKYVIQEGDVFHNNGFSIKQWSNLPI